MSGEAQKVGLRTFHATLAVTRLEEWCVDANTPEEAKALLAAGGGHRCHLECLHVELQQIEDGSRRASDTATPQPTAPNRAHTVLSTSGRLCGARYRASTFGWFEKLPPISTSTGRPLNGWQDI